MLARPFLEEKSRGLFSIRAPKRPNPVGLTVVKLIKRQRNRLGLGGVDMPDGTPLLDIKPYIPAIDAHVEATDGWISGKKRKDHRNKLSDGRFRKQIRGDDRI